MADVGAIQGDVMSWVLGDVVYCPAETNIDCCYYASVFHVEDIESMAYSQGSFWITES